MPNALVQESGMNRPITWPMITSKLPKWNIGLPIDSNRDS
ncbi:Uncharacterised protein [Mycobacterium tuberculosis]|uniref:Uncharacterized protein n=1 Tax=Mycobacterium tuberculosis TaxID=1773 RepID=A0A0U0UPB4_MYCTX|nr:Uncharacterised protein [Mycobacterium tuberculosis]CKT68155.1 Uncharacterised protein [Mycobacterium tuberculosis]CKT72480.1 Uncharacterised protein [Mycobacterium tuberculosis]CKU23979.1 Uncharacterised protein [Mycobacterium tuberculosis]COV97843.1 Uncharacterised protein [Mycobacterium tuberculosis]